MIGNILESTANAQKKLADFQTSIYAKQYKKAAFHLQEAICAKLMIPFVEEPSIRNLVILSIKLQEGMTNKAASNIILHQVVKYDCHQTSLVAKKKTLLIMFIEKNLGITLNDDEAVKADTTLHLAELLTNAIETSIQ